MAHFLKRLLVSLVVFILGLSFQVVQAKTLLLDEVLPQPNPMVTVAEENSPAEEELTLATKEGMVMFNTKTHKYHSPGCTWARRCTVNCILVPLSEALRRGGVPCKVCGG